MITPRPVHGLVIRHAFLSGIEVPDAVEQQVGLDASPQWVIFGEVNRFGWPGLDLRPIPGRDSPAYGVLPAPFFEAVRRGLLAHHRARRAAITDRD